MKKNIHFAGHCLRVDYGLEVLAKLEEGTGTTKSHGKKVSFYYILQKVRLTLNGRPFIMERKLRSVDGGPYLQSLIINGRRYYSFKPLLEYLMAF